jgi:hypothetical protein
MKSFVTKRALATTRTLFLLGLGIWLGGLVCVASGAPSLVHASLKLTGSKAIGFQMVGTLMGAFTPLTYICALLIAIGWLGERAAAASAGCRKSWTLQGVGIGIMIVIAAYCGRVVMPDMAAMQPQVLSAFHPQPSAAVNSGAAPAAPSQATATPEALAVKVRFDKAHETFRTMTSLIVLLALINLIIFAVEVSRVPQVD